MGGELGERRVHVQSRDPGLLGAHVLRRPDQHPLLRVNRTLGQLLARRLGHAEIDHFHLRPLALDRHQNVRRLHVPVDDPLLVRMLQRLAGLQEQLEPLADRQPLLVAVVRDRQTRDVLHHEVRPPVLAEPCIVHLGHVGVIHQRQRLTLRLEARDHLLRVHPELDQLQGHAAPYRFGLLGQVHDPHPALAQQIQDPVAADALGTGGTRRRLEMRHLPRAQIQTQAEQAGRTAPARPRPRPEHGTTTRTTG